MNYEVGQKVKVERTSRYRAPMVHDAVVMRVTKRGVVVRFVGSAEEGPLGRSLRIVGNQDDRNQC